MFTTRYGSPSPPTIASSIARMRSCSSPRRRRARRTRTSRPCRTGARGRCRACPCRRCRPRAGSTSRSRRSGAGSASASRISPRCSAESGTSLVPTRNSSPSSTSYTWLRSVGKKPGLFHRVLAHEHRRHDRREALARRARSSPSCTSASSSSTASRMTYANREPLASAACVGVDEARSPRRTRRGRAAARRACRRRPARTSPSSSPPSGTDASAGFGTCSASSRSARLERRRASCSCALAARPSASPRPAIFAGRSSGAALPISFDAAFCRGAQLLDLAEQRAARVVGREHLVDQARRARACARCRAGTPARRAAA